MSKEKRMQNMNDVTKKERVNELSDKSLENASGGVVTDHHQFGYEVSYRDKKGKLRYFFTMNRDEAIAFDKAHGGDGRIRDAYRGIYLK